MDYFSGIIGQDRAVQLLSKAVKTRNINHAYLFLGPAGTGKMLCAKAFAGAIIQQEDKNAQLYFKENVHPDLLIIEKAENKTMVTKDQIKQMEEWFALKPYRALHRVAIIRDCHRMTLEASNAILKILEEPHEYGIIILVSDENNLLETIISRCQLVRFFAIADSDIEDFLIKKSFDRDTACRAARLGQGSIANAVHFAGEKDFQDKWEVASEIIKSLAEGEVVEVYWAAERMEADPFMITNMLEAILRDIYIYRETKDEKLIQMPDSIKLAGLIKRVNAVRLREALTEINNLKPYYNRNVNSLLININISYKIWESLRASDF